VCGGVTQVRSSKTFTAIGLFLCVVMMVRFPYISDAGKRMAGIFLTVTALVTAVTDQVQQPPYIVD
jgi:hypothetical protein